MSENLSILGRYGEWAPQFSRRVALITEAMRSPDHATELCSIMAHHGSDKGIDRHNYTKVYHALFSDHRHEPLNVFEVGLGTNNPEVPSSMGEHGIPGASLRGWREYFPNASIVGADVDKRVLFSDERIETHFVDQLDAATIRAMWAEIGPREFTLIIDDGLHTFPANATFVAESIGRLSQNGYLVVEDIVDHNVNLMLFDAFLRGLRHQAALIRLHHKTNTVDNVIALIGAS